MYNPQQHMTRILLAIEQPDGDPGPFEKVWEKVGGVLIWGATIAGVAAIIWAGSMLAWEKLDPSKEPVSGKAIMWAVVGGVIAASAAQIINWSYGTT